MDETGITPRITVDDHADLHIVLTALNLAADDLLTNYSTQLGRHVRDYNTDNDVVTLTGLRFMSSTVGRICTLIETLNTPTCTAMKCELKAGS